MKAKIITISIIILVAIIGGFLWYIFNIGNGQEHNSKTNDLTFKNQSGNQTEEIDSCLTVENFKLVRNFVLENGGEEIENSNEIVWPTIDQIPLSEDFYPTFNHRITYRQNKNGVEELEMEVFQGIHLPYALVLKNNTIEILEKMELEETVKDKSYVLEYAKNDFSKIIEKIQQEKRRPEGNE